MTEYRLVKPLELSEKTKFDYTTIKSINRKYSAVLEELVDGKVVYAWPIQDVSEIWDIVDEDSDIKIMM